MKKKLAVLLTLIMVMMLLPVNMAFAKDVPFKEILAEEDAEGVIVYMAKGQRTNTIKKADIAAIIKANAYVHITNFQETIGITMTADMLLSAGIDGKNSVTVTINEPSVKQLSKRVRDGINNAKTALDKKDATIIGLYEISITNGKSKIEAFDVPVGVSVDITHFNMSQDQIDNTLCIGIDKDSRVVEYEAGIEWYEFEDEVDLTGIITYYTFDLREIGGIILFGK